MSEIGNEMHVLCKELFPICRSITGKGVRDTLAILKNHLPAMNIIEVPSGTRCFDWEIPLEWNIEDAYVIDPDGNIIIDFKTSNLHVMGYSIPVNKTIPLVELKEHLYSLPDQPDAIPYVTSYYKERWGFCISYNEMKKLKDGNYQVVIKSHLNKGSLSYGELIIPGATSKEVFLSTYICHPSMANNELSGPVVVTFLAKWLSKRNKNRFTYRIIFIPETIGSITYLTRNISLMKKNIIAGFNVSCVGDNRAYSYLPSRKGDTLSDQIAKHILKWIDSSYKTYTWKDRGSDERQYCAPGVDLPIASIMRTKYGQYPEYHTSLDNLTNVVTPEGLEGGYYALKLAIEAIEKNCYPKVTVYGEPQLGKRGLYPTISTKTSANEVRLMMDLITWSDGTYSLLDIADKCGVPIWDLYPIVDKLVTHNLLDI